MTLLAILALGFFLGMRHATDTDHVVAVTTIVSRERSLRGAVFIGALWGLGHSVTILIVGGAIIVFGWVVPPHIGLSMEMSVAVMLIVLGAMNLSGAMQRIDEAAHANLHEHGNQAARPSLGFGRGVLARTLRPLVVGVVHGLAGSAAVALLVLATIREPSWALLYLAVFGAGTVAGMVALTLAMATPLAVVSRRFNAERALARITGIASIAFGLFMAYQIGVLEGLFTGAPHWHPH